MFARFLDLPKLIDSVWVHADFTEGGLSKIEIDGVDETASAKILDIMNEGMDLGQQMVLMQIAEGMGNEDPALQESVSRYVERVGNYMKANFKPAMNGKTLAFNFEQSSGATSVATIGVLTGMLLPAVQQVREAARRTTAMNDLRQLALAAHNFESAHQDFPAHAIYSDDGRPLLSWRVELLPYLEHSELYEQFNLDEPWDSPNNIELLNQMPEIFRSPNSVHENKTVYQALIHEGSAFDGTKNGIGFTQMRDGTSNTIMFVEANDDFAVEWTKPADLNFDPDNPKRGLGELRPGGFNAALCDGSVQFLSASITGEILRRLALRNDGEIVDFDF